jgi:hypothetical protein
MEKLTIRVETESVGDEFCFFVSPGLLSPQDRSGVASDRYTHGPMIHIMHKTQI